MSSIMKGIVDEGDKSNPFQDGYDAWKAYQAGETNYPKCPYPAGQGMGRWYDGQAAAAEDGDYSVNETEAKKGADGKRCWKGKRYAGTENGKDKCIPVNEFADDEKSEEPRKEFPIEVYIHSILHNKTLKIIGEKLGKLDSSGNIKTRYTLPISSGETVVEWLPVADKKYPTGKLSDNVHLKGSQLPTRTLSDGVFKYWAYVPQLSESTDPKWEVAIEYGPTAHDSVTIKVSAPDANTAQNKALALFKKKYPDRRGMVGGYTKLDEGVIIGHDANDPEVAILGGAGTMSLSRLKKKAQGEAEQLANDLARGRFKAAAYNIKQLENTLKTIVAAEDEMSKKYFGENAWNQLGQRKPNTNLPAPERGSRVNHGKRFEEGDIVLPLSGPLKGQPHKVIHSQRTVIRIVPLGRNTYPGDTIAPRTKHEWVVPADTNEDYTGEFAAEKTPAINPYGGLKDRQFRGAISETPTDNPTGASGEGGWRRTDLDEYREMSPALKAAQQNLIALRNKEKAVSVPGKRERVARDKVELDNPKPATVLTKGAQEVDPDTMDAIAAFLAKGGEIKKGRPGKAPPTGRQQASKHIGGGGKYRKKSDTPGQGANYRGDKDIQVESKITSSAILKGIQGK